MMESEKTAGRRPDDAATVPFRGFDSYGEVRIYNHGLLPHWRQSGCTYFVTFRLADALPRGVVAEWEAERDDWLRRRGIDPETDRWRQQLRQLPPAEVIEFERDFGEKLDGYLDAGHGACLLRNGKVGDLVERSLRHFHGRRVWTGDHVVMPNHVHALMRPKEHFELEDVLQSIKSFTAHRINELCGSAGSVWQKESYDRIVRDRKELVAFQEYIHANPIKAQLKKETYRISERVNFETM